MNKLSMESRVKSARPQGIPASRNQTTNALNSINKNPKNHKTMNTFKPFTSVFFAFIAILFFANTAFGQTTVNSDITNHPYALNNTSPAGDTIRLELELGDGTENVESALGYEVEIKFPNWTGEPSDVSFDFSESWLGDVTVGDADWSYDADNAVLTISFERNDMTFQTGAGIAVEATLVPQVGGLSMTDKDAQIETGIITLENGEFKTIPSVTEEALTQELDLLLFPNPAQDIVNLQTSAHEGQVRIYDLNGRVWYQSPAFTSQIDVSQFPAGMYILELQADGHNTQERLVVK